MLAQQVVVILMSQHSSLRNIPWPQALLALERGRLSIFKDVAVRSPIGHASDAKITHEVKLTTKPAQKHEMANPAPGMIKSISIIETH